MKYLINLKNYGNLIMLNRFLILLMIIVKNTMHFVNSVEEKKLIKKESYNLRMKSIG